MPSPLNQFTPDKQYADGFTLIEIVMVLVLLGILSAVAVPKYFDLQEEAIAKKCQHNRGVVQSSVITQYAAAQLDGTADSINDEGWEAKIDLVMQDLGGTNCKNHSACEKLCEAGGQYDVTFDRTDGNLVVTVTCDHPGHGSSSSGNNSNNSSTIFFGKSEADFGQWLKDNYQQLMDSTFTKDDGGNPDASIDAISEKIRAALEEKFDLSKSALLITRKDYGLFNDDDKCISSTGAYSGADRNQLHWKSELFVTVVSSEGLTDGAIVSGTVYSMILDYNKQYSTDEKKVEKFGDFKRNDDVGTVDCVVSSAGTDKNGNPLFTISHKDKW